MLYSRDCAGKNTVVSSSLELQSGLYLVFGQAAPAAAGAQWALSSRRGPRARCREPRVRRAGGGGRRKRPPSLHPVSVTGAEEQEEKGALLPVPSAPPPPQPGAGIWHCLTVLGYCYYCIIIYLLIIAFLFQEQRALASTDVPCGVAFLCLASDALTLLNDQDLLRYKPEAAVGRVPSRCFV